jgi:APA family basic amino acid/polyamine antiporter
MLKASTYAFFAYVGFESVAAAAQEAKEPTRSLPISIIGSLIISMIFYLGICTIMVGIVSYTSLDTESPLSEAM